MFLVSKLGCGDSTYSGQMPSFNGGYFYSKDSILLGYCPLMKRTRKYLLQIPYHSCGPLVHVKIPILNVKSIFFSKCKNTYHQTMVPLDVLCFVTFSCSFVICSILLHHFLFRWNSRKIPTMSWFCYQNTFVCTIVWQWNHLTDTCHCKG